MRRVITVSLNGNAFQFEEDACTQLDAWLDDAARTLAGDPDRQEIIADLEQAIADKCQRFLGPHKNVLTRAEIDTVLAEMGPVHAPEAPQSPGAQRPPSADAAGAAPGPAPRRLYQISEGAMISGVCNGIAAYFSIDVTLVRVLAVALAFLSFGLAVLAYVILMFVVPYATTSEERAAAHGMPFNARVLVERTKQKAREFARDAGARAGSEWRQGWRHARAEWRAARRQARAQRREARWQARWAQTPAAQPAGIAQPMYYTAHVFTRLAMMAVGLLLAALSIACVLSALSFLTTGAFFGRALPFHAPAWVILVGLFLCYGMISSPLRHARRAAFVDTWPHPGGWLAGLDAVLMLGVLIVLGVWAAHHMDQVNALAAQLRDWWQGLTGDGMAHHTTIT